MVSPETLIAMKEPSIANVAEPARLQRCSSGMQCFPDSPETSQRPHSWFAINQTSRKRTCTSAAGSTQGLQHLGDQQQRGGQPSPVAQLAAVAVSSLAAQAWPAMATLVLLPAQPAPAPQLRPLPVLRMRKHLCPRLSAPPRASSALQSWCCQLRATVSGPSRLPACPASCACNQPSAPSALSAMQVAVVPVCTNCALIKASRMK